MIRSSLFKTLAVHAASRVISREIAEQTSQRTDRCTRRPPRRLEVGKPPFAIRRPCGRREPRVCLGGGRRLLLDASPVFERRRRDYVQNPLPPATRADSEHDRWAVARADDRVGRPTGAVKEVPGFEGPYH